jgi:hypothetical protein
MVENDPSLFCRECGKPMFLLRVMPASQRDPEMRFFECSACQLPYAEIPEKPSANS